MMASEFYMLSAGQISPPGRQFGPAKIMPGIYRTLYRHRNGCAPKPFGAQPGSRKPAHSRQVATALDLDMFNRAATRPTTGAIIAVHQAHHRPARTSTATGAYGPMPWRNAGFRMHFLAKTELGPSEKLKPKGVMADLGPPGAQAIYIQYGFPGATDAELKLKPIPPAG
jgi:hypothetical protein